MGEERQNNNNEEQNVLCCIMGSFQIAFRVEMRDFACGTQDGILVELSWCRFPTDSYPPSVTHSHESTIVTCFSLFLDFEILSRSSLVISSTNYILVIIKQ